MFSTGCTSEQSSCLGKLLPSRELTASFLNSLKTWDVICASRAELSWWGRVRKLPTGASCSSLNQANF